MFLSETYCQPISVILLCLSDDNIVRTQAFQEYVDKVRQCSCYRRHFELLNQFLLQNYYRSTHYFLLYKNTLRFNLHTLHIYRELCLSHKLTSLPTKTNYLFTKGLLKSNLYKLSINLIHFLRHCIKPTKVPSSLQYYKIKVDLHEAYVIQIACLHITQNVNIDLISSLQEHFKVDFHTAYIQLQSINCDI